MIDGLVIKKLIKNEDERGWLAEIFRKDETDFSPTMAYVSLTKPGAIRGPHEHRKQTDFFVFAGPGSYELHLWDNREGSAAKGEYQKIGAGQDDPKTVMVPPGVVHGYKCVSTREGLCVNFPDRLYRGEGKNGDVDEIRWEQDANSPFKIL